MKIQILNVDFIYLYNLYVCVCVWKSKEKQQQSSCDKVFSEREKRKKEDKKYQSGLMSA